MSKEFYDWETVASPGGGMDMLSNSVRKGIKFDSFAGVTQFRARVLTDAYPLNSSQAELFDSADTPLRSSDPNAGDNFTNDNVEVARRAGGVVRDVATTALLKGTLAGRIFTAVTADSDDDTAATTPDDEPTPLGFSRWIFKARILGKNSPHSFIPDPCDPAFVECPEKALPYVMMHTSFITTNDSTSGMMEPIRKGDIVLVHLTQNEFSFNLQFGQFIKRETTSAQDIEQLKLQQKEAACQSLSNMFKVSPGKPVHPSPHPQNPSAGPHIWKGTIFDANGWLKSQYVPERIQEIPDSLNAWLRAQGRTNVTISSNGTRRGVSETFAGGAGRIPTSYHMFGLAHDLKLETPAVTRYAYPDSNDVLIKDHQLMRLLKKYAAEKGLVWGGAWRQGTPEQIPAGDGVEAFTAYTMELHHFELPQDQLEQNLHPRVVEALRQSNRSTSEFTGRSSNRRDLYNEIAGEFGVA